ncbi:MAG: VWA domain-containing protein, partial [Actinomycetota bacterium]
MAGLTREVESGELPPPSGLLKRLLDFIRALRRAGVPVAVSDDIEAFRLLRHVDLLVREQLRAGLAAVLIKTHAHRQIFDDLFEIYFPARPGGENASGAAAQKTEPPQAPADSDEFTRELLAKLMDGDRAEIRRMARDAVQRFGRVQDPSGQPTYFRYKVFRAVDLNQMLVDLLTGRAAASGGEPSAIQQRLWRDEFEARLEAFRREVEAEIRRRAAAQRGPDHVADRFVRPPLAEEDFLRLNVEDQAAMRRQLRPLARKLATRLAAKRKHGRAGRLDVRRTVRHSLSTGGVPFEPSFRPRRPHKPELFLICDISGSVSAFAHFTLMLVHTLQEQFSKVRSFAFVDTLDEVTELFEQGDLAQAVSRLKREADVVWLDGHSDYGHSLEHFHAHHANDITAKTSVIILGDARNNFRSPSEW